MKIFVVIFFGLIIVSNGLMFAIQSQDWVADTPVEMQGIAKLIAGIGVLLWVSLMGIFLVLILKDDD